MKGQAFWIILAIILVGVLIVFSAQKSTNTTTIIFQNITTSTNATINTTINITINGSFTRLPAANITNGTFGSAFGDRGNYSFPNGLNVSGDLGVRNIFANAVLFSNATTFFIDMTSSASTASLCLNCFSAIPINLGGYTNVLGNLTVSGNLTIGDNIIGTDNLTIQDNATILGNSTIVQEILIRGATGSGQVLCVKPDGFVGTCTTIVGITGACTCA